MSSRKTIIDLRKANHKQTPIKVETISHTEKRAIPLRVRRHRLRIFVLVIFATLVVVLIYAIHWASYLPRYTINQVNVEGVRALSPSLISAYAQAHIYDGTLPFISRANIFLFDTKALARDIATSFPRIKDASVSRESLLATAIVVRVYERQAYALWCIDDARTECYMLDENGFIFAHAPAEYSASSTSSGYIFAGGIATSSDAIGQIGMRGHLPGIIALLKTLADEGLTPQGATVADGDDFSVPLTEGFYIKASFGADAQMLAQNLRLILSSDALKNKTDQLEYVDLRFGNRVYFRLKGEAKSENAARE